MPAKQPAINRRRFLRFSLIGAASAVILAACGSPAASEPTAAPAAPAPADKEQAPAKGNTPAAAAAPATKGAVSLRFHARLGSESGGKYWTERFEAFQKAQSDIKVTLEAPADAPNYYPKIQSMAAGGQLGDVMWLSIGQGLYHFFAARGITKPIAEFIDRDKFDLSPFWPVAIDVLKYKSILYGLPIIVHTGPSLVVYNKALIKSNGLKDPTRDWTLDELLQDAIKLTADTDSDGKIDQFGFFPDRGYQNVVIWLRTFGGDLMSADGTKSVLDSDEALTAVQWLYDLYYKHKAGPNPGQLQGGATQMFGTSKLALFQSGMWAPPGVVPVVEKKFEFFIGPLPKGPTGNRGSFFQADIISITGQTKNPDASWELIKFLSSKESHVQRMLSDSLPAARKDAFDAPEIANDLYLKPVYSPALDEAMPIHLASNYRTTDVIDTVQQTFDAIWLDKEKPTKDFMRKAHSALQEVLDKPEP